MTSPVPDAALRAALEHRADRIAEHLTRLGTALVAAEAMMGEAEREVASGWRELRLLRARVAGEGEP